MIRSFPLRINFFLGLSFLGGLFFLSSALCASQNQKSTHLLATASQFSGALQWAHAKGFTGEKEDAIVIEEDFPPASLQSDLGDLLCFFPTDPKEWKRSNLFPVNHSALVIDVLHQIAPKSRITLLERTASMPTLSWEEKFKNDPVLEKRIKNSLVVNMSYLIVSLTNSQEYTAISLQRELANNHKRIRSLWQQGQSKLLCKGAGNDALSLSTALPAKDGHSIESDALTLLADETLGKYVIIIGGLAQESGPYKHTNYPGENPRLQENFISTLGEKIRTKEAFHQGTSLSTPIVGGASLLLKEAYPSLSVLDIKEVLLESASRNFFIRPHAYIIKPAINGTFVYDPEEGPPDVSKLKGIYLQDIWKKSYTSLVEKFDPQKYGKGMLDLRAAFIYADLKVHHPQWNKEQLRKMMKLQMVAEDHAAAALIQSTFRTYKERKYIKRLESVAIPSFTPLKAPEDYSLPPSSSTSPSSQNTGDGRSPVLTPKNLIKKKIRTPKAPTLYGTSRHKKIRIPKIKAKEKALV